MLQSPFKDEMLFQSWQSDFEQVNIIFFYSMFGYGKEYKALEFAKKYFDNHICVDAKDKCFLKEFESELANDSKTKKLIIVKNLHFINKEKDIEKVDNIISGFSDTDNNIKIILLSNSGILNYILPLQFKNKIAVYDKNSLILSPDEIVNILKTYPNFAGLSLSELNKIADKCYVFCSGFAIACIIYINKLSENIHDLQGAYGFAIDDLNNYFNIKLQDINFEYVELLTKLSVFDSFTNEMASLILNEDEMLLLNDINRFGGILSRKSPNFFAYEKNIHRYFWNLFKKKNNIEILKTAAEIHENNRNFKMALKCYKILNDSEKMAQLIIYLSKNADGCEFAVICNKYISDLPPDMLENNAELLGAMALIEAYNLRKDGYQKYLDEIKQLAIKEKKEKTGTTALRTYMRTIIACPLSSAETLKDNLMMFSDGIVKKKIRLDNIMPSGNMPGILNGGLDLLNWIHINKSFHYTLKKAVEIVIGLESIGCFNTLMGEMAYERCDNNMAIKHLTNAKYEAEKAQNLRIEYAAIGALAKVFISENESQKANLILEEFCQKAKKANYNELLPNVYSSLTLVSLYHNNYVYYNSWLANFAPNEYGDFYFTARYALLTKAKVYMAGARYLDALFILNLLEPYAVECERNYYLIKINLLKAVIYHRRNEEWLSCFLNSVKKASEYKIFPAVAEEGAPVLELFDKTNWDDCDIDEQYIEKLKTELEKTAKNYPNYLIENEKHVYLTNKEQEVVRLIAKGLKNAQIASELYINIGTVKFHISNIMSKFDVDSRALIVKKAHEHEYI